MLIFMLAIAAVLTGYRAYGIMSYKPRHAIRDHNLPSQEFLRTFAEPLKPLAQEMIQKIRPIYTPTSHLLPNDGRRWAYAWEHLSLFGPVEARHELDVCLTMGSCAFVTVGLSSADWAQAAEDSLLHTRHGVFVPSGTEYDMHLDEFEPVDPIVHAMLLAAKIEPSAKARIYHLAAEYGVESKFAREVLNNQFGANAKSASSTVSPDIADAFREFMNTHADV